MIWKNIRIEKILHVINIGVALSCIGFLAISIINDYYWRADFTAFYTGGALLRDSHGSQLFDLELQTQYQKEILHDRSFEDGVLPFNYPPFVAFLFLPLSYLPLNVAYYLWTFFQIILLVILIKLLINISASWEPNERDYLIVTSLAMPYLLITLLLGTFSLLMLIGIVQFYFSLKTSQYFKAGLWLTLLAIKPQILIVPVIIVLSSRRWKTLTGSLFNGLILFMLTGTLLGWQIWVDFLERLTISSTYFEKFGVYPGTMHNLKGVITSILGGNQVSLINTISFAAFILMLFFVFFLWWGNLDTYTLEFELKFSLSMTLAILFSPHLNPQDSLLLIAPMTVFLNFQNLLKSNRRYYILFLLSIPLLSWLSEFWIKDSLYIRPTILLTLILMIWIIHSYYKMRKLSNQKILDI
jgi:hypothetical protein